MSRSFLARIKAEDAARKWLLETLRRGPLPEHQLRDLAMAAGIDIVLLYKASEGHVRQFWMWVDRQRVWSWRLLPQKEGTR